MDKRLKKLARSGNLDDIKHAARYSDINIYENDHYIVRWCARNGHLEALKYLVEECGGKLTGTFDIKWAALNGHKDVVIYILSKVETVNLSINSRYDLLHCEKYYDILYEICRQHRHEMMRIFNWSGDIAINFMQYVIDNGGDPIFKDMAWVHTKTEDCAKTLYARIDAFKFWEKLHDNFEARLHRYLQLLVFHDEGGAVTNYLIEKYKPEMNRLYDNGKRLITLCRHRCIAEILIKFGADIFTMDEYAISYVDRKKDERWIYDQKFRICPWISPDSEVSFKSYKHPWARFDDKYKTRSNTQHVMGGDNFMVVYEGMGFRHNYQ